MNGIDTSRVDTRYWTALTLISVFGMKVGGFGSHRNGHGFVRGFALFALLLTIALAVEHLEGYIHETYYFVAIGLIRTGATTVAGYLPFHRRIPVSMLTLTLAAVLLLCGWAMRRSVFAPGTLPETNAAHWFGVLREGAFGTVVDAVHLRAINEGVNAALVSGSLLLAMLVVRGIAAKVKAIGQGNHASVPYAHTASSWTGGNRIPA